MRNALPTKLKLHVACIDLATSDSLTNIKY